MQAAQPRCCGAATVSAAAPCFGEAAIAAQAGEHSRMLPDIIRTSTHPICAAAAAILLNVSGRLRRVDASSQVRSNRPGASLFVCNAADGKAQINEAATVIRRTSASRQLAPAADFSAAVSIARQRTRHLRLLGAYRVIRCVAAGGKCRWHVADPGTIIGLTRVQSKKASRGCDKSQDHRRNSHSAHFHG